MYKEENKKSLMIENFKKDKNLWTCLEIMNILINL